MDDHLVSRDRFLGVTTFIKAIIAVLIKKCFEVVYACLYPFLGSKVKACVWLGSKYSSCSCKACFVGIEGKEQSY